MKSIKIQVFSDLHLELFAKAFPKPKPLSPYLFLAGDIGNPEDKNFKDFINYCNNNWSKTFYVFGNHDVWHKTKHLNEIKEELKSYVSQNNLNNIKLLDNGQIDKINNDIYVIGSTFWTRNLEEESKLYLNDFNMIRIKDINMTRLIEPLDLKTIANNEFNLLHSLLNYSDTIASKYIIVLTHFPPYRTGTSHPKFHNEKGIVKNYFSWPNETLSEFNTSNILAWISGHTHYSYDFKCEQSVRLISNQMGYLRECQNGSTNFDHDGLFEIDYMPL